MNKFLLRSNPPPTPEQILGLPVRVSPSAWRSQPRAHVAAEHTLSPNHIAVGVIRSYITGHYHAVLSLYGTDLTTLGVFAAMPPAEETTRAFGELFIGWYERPEGESRARQVTLLAAAAAASVSPPNAWLLPEAQVRAFLAEVARRVQRAN